MREILQKAPASAPVTHALVVGVSHYRHFADGCEPSSVGASWGMAQLTAAASSAAAVADWLVHAYRSSKPLQSLRLLLSPQEGEELGPAINGRAKRDLPRACRANVERAIGEFIADCNANRDNVAFVYLVGHGVRMTKLDATVLLDDIGAPTHLTSLQGAIDARRCHEGMDHGDAPSTQFWFVDACRQTPEIASKFETMNGALMLDSRRGNTISAPLFLAASSGESAFARRRKKTLFCEALLFALNGTAAIGPDRRSNKWYVSTLSLNERLTDTVKALAARGGEEQSVDPCGRMTNAVVHQFDNPPSVPLRLTLRPSKARQVSTAHLARDARHPVKDVPSGWPIKMELPAGLYTIDVKTKSPFVPYRDILRVLPPNTSKNVSV